MDEKAILLGKSYSFLGEELAGSQIAQNAVLLLYFLFVYECFNVTHRSIGKRVAPYIHYLSML